jgi:hypothetical protein
MFETFTAVMSSGAVLLLAWMAKTMNDLSIKVAVIEQIMSNETSKPKGKINAKSLRLASK